MFDKQNRLFIIGNEPSPYFRSMNEQPNARNHVSFYRFKEAALADVLARPHASCALIDLTEADEYVLGVIGRLQEADSNGPLICLSPRLPAGTSLMSREGTFLFLSAPLALFMLPQVPQHPLLPLQSSFRGEFQAGSLQEVVQLLIVAGISGRLVVWRRWTRGELWFHDGYVVHAELGERRGRAALGSLLEWPRGTFRLQRGGAPAFSVKIGLSDPILQSLGEFSSSEPALFNAADSAEFEQIHSLEPQEELDFAEAATIDVPAISTASDDAGIQSREQIERSVEQAWLQIEANNFAAAVEEEAVEREALVEKGEPEKENALALTNDAVKEALLKLEHNVDGFIDASIADSDSGRCLGWAGERGTPDVELAAAGNIEVVRAKRRVMQSLNLHDEIDDILISLENQYHLIRPLRSQPSIFIHLTVARSRANLAMARFALAESERDLGI